MWAADLSDLCSQGLCSSSSRDGVRLTPHFSLSLSCLHFVSSKTERVRVRTRFTLVDSVSLQADEHLGTRSREKALSSTKVLNSEQYTFITGTELHMHEALIKKRLNSARFNPSFCLNAEKVKAVHEP